MPPRAWTSNDTERLQELHSAGWTVGKIATELGFSKSTVSRRARDAGLDFSRSQTATATVAHQLSAAEKAAALQNAILDDGLAIAERLRGNAHVTVLKGERGAEEITILASPLASDWAALSRAAQGAFSVWVKAQALQQGESAQRTQGLLQALAGALDAQAADEAVLYSAPATEAPEEAQ